MFSYQRRNIWIVWAIAVFTCLETNGQTVVGLGRFPNERDFRFATIRLQTGVAEPLNPASPTAYGGLAATPTGQFFGTVRVSGITNLHAVDIATNTSTVIGLMDGGTSVNFASLDILPDGRAFAVSLATAVLFPQLFAIDLGTAAVTPVNQQRTISDAIIAAGNPDGYFADVGSLGSVANTLYAIDLKTFSLVSLDPNTGAAAVVGGTAGLLTQGELAGGIARSRYTGFAGLTGIDSNADGQFDTLLGVVNTFDDDNDPATPRVPIGGIAKFDLVTGQWDLIGTNPGVQFASLASIPVPEPSSLSVTLSGLAAVIGARIRRRQNHRLR